MTTLSVTFCDRCNQGLKLDRDVRPTSWVMAGKTVAVQDFGWKKIGHDVICTQCIEEEETDKETQ